MRVRRKVAAAALAGGILAGGVALAAPASAISKVTCPTPPTRAYGVEVSTDYGFNACYAGSVGAATLNVSRVYLASSQWNYATVWFVGGYTKLATYSSVNYNVVLGHTVTVYEVDIT
ncbi:hypothetical protein OG900_18810 [Streptomyces sp. NBC_00433]